VCTYSGLALLAIALLVAAGGMLTSAEVGPGLLIALTVMLALGGLQLVALGVVGEYVWRALDEARRRPAFLIEEIAGSITPPVALHE